MKVQDIRIDIINLMSRSKVLSIESQLIFDTSKPTHLNKSVREYLVLESSGLSRHIKINQTHSCNKILYLICKFQ